MKSFFNNSKGVPMTTAQLLHVLDNFHMSQVSKMSFPPRPRKQYQERNMSKEDRNRIFKQHLVLLGLATLFSLLVVVLPLYLLDISVGKAVFISIPPMLLLALSWMLPVWKFGKSRYILMAMTIGASPVRIFAGVAFSYLIYTIPGVNFVAFFIGMVCHYSLFLGIEISMFSNFSKQV